MVDFNKVKDRNVDFDGVECSNWTTGKPIMVEEACQNNPEFVDTWCLEKNQRPEDLQKLE